MDGTVLGGIRGLVGLHLRDLAGLHVLLEGHLQGGPHRGTQLVEHGELLAAVYQMPLELQRTPFDLQQRGHVGAFIDDHQVVDLGGIFSHVQLGGGGGQGGGVELKHVPHAAAHHAGGVIGIEEQFHLQGLAASMHKLDAGHIGSQARGLAVFCPPLLDVGLGIVHHIDLLVVGLVGDAHLFQGHDHIGVWFADLHGAPPLGVIIGPACAGPV